MDKEHFKEDKRKVPAKVKVIVTPVYVGTKTMNEVFTDVVYNNIQKNIKVSQNIINIWLARRKTSDYNYVN